MGRRATALRSAGLALALLFGVLLFGACSREARPSAAVWQRTWIHARALVPAREVFAGGGERELCDRALAELRVAHRRLAWTPNDVLDHGAGAWLSFAEGMMGECPLQGGSHAGFDAGFRELERLEVEVDAVLALAHGEAR